MFIVLGKSFIVKHYYDMHMATHTEVEDNQLPYVCNICKKLFATSQILVTHQLKHQTKGYSNEIKSNHGSDIEKLKNEVNITIYLN